MCIRDSIILVIGYQGEKLRTHIEKQSRNTPIEYIYNPVYNKTNNIPVSYTHLLGFFVASLGIAHSAYLFRNLMVKQKAMAVTIGLTASGTIGITMALSLIHILFFSC